MRDLRDSGDRVGNTVSAFEHPTDLRRLTKPAWRSVSEVWWRMSKRGTTANVEEHRSGGRGMSGRWWLRESEGGIWPDD